MVLDISKLKRERSYKNDKIRISFSTGDISNALSVYLIDKDSKEHHILWKISPDRCIQSFDKSNEKIRTFVSNKINEWVSDEEQSEFLRKERIKEKDFKKENELKKIIDSF